MDLNGAIATYFNSQHCYLHLSKCQFLLLVLNHYPLGKALAYNFVLQTWLWSLNFGEPQSYLTFILTRMTCVIWRGYIFISCVCVQQSLLSVFEKNSFSQKLSFTPWWFIDKKAVESFYYSGHINSPTSYNLSRKIKSLVKC